MNTCDCGERTEMVEKIPDSEPVKRRSSSACSAIKQSILEMEARREANKKAAVNSPDCATWSNGVAAGLNIAIKILKQNVQG